LLKYLSTNLTGDSAELKFYYIMFSVVLFKYLKEFYD